jgi:hypothetical protein
MGKLSDLYKSTKRFFFKKKPAYELTDEDRQKGQEVIQLNAKINLLERQLIQQRRLEKLESAIIGGSKENDLEAAFIGQILPMLLAGKTPNPHAPQLIPTETTATQPANNGTLTEAELNKISDALKPYAGAYKQQIAALSDSEILTIRKKLIQ